MIDFPIHFRLPKKWGLLEIAPHVLAHFEVHKQRKMFAREAGGQLFASFEHPSVMKIVDVTGPRQTDKRSMYNYQPDRNAERAEIKERFARGLHFVGDWHTHRQRIPHPSSTDEDSIGELVRFSAHDLPGFVMIIVGQGPFPEGLHVSFHFRAGSEVLDSAVTAAAIDHG
jgi:integrative and conjugative element protein (TIGR02256 family)